MESTESVKHTLHPLKDDYFIDEVELTHTVGTDFWIGKADSDQRTWLANSWETAKKLAEEKIG